MKHSQRRSKRVLGLSWGLAVLSVALLSACISKPRPDAVRALSQIEAGETSGVAERAPAGPTPQQRLVDLVATSSAPAPDTEAYRIGPGDEIEVIVLGQPDLSARHRVAPDGRVHLPLARSTQLSGRTRAEASELLREKLRAFFVAEPEVSVEVTDYQNNKVYVLGRVERPGAVELTGAGSLLQVLSEAGGLPVREFRSFLSQCAILRGRDEILWIDLIDLLQHGNIALNVPLRNGDVVFLPDAEDTNVFVMGEVRSPGAVPIKVRMDVVQALAQAGGPTDDANLERVYLVRPGEFGPDKPLRIDFEHLVETGDFRENLELRSGDILYVSRTGIGDVNYYLRRLAPATSAAALSQLRIR